MAIDWGSRPADSPKHGIGSPTNIDFGQRPGDARKKPLSGEPADPVRPPPRGLDTEVYFRAQQTGERSIGEASPVSDQEALEDAWSAEYGDEGDATELARGSKARAVIGHDDREQILDTEGYPHRSVCSLTITAANGKRYVGSGFLVTPRTVVTAGHCLYSKQQGGWVQCIEVMPGRNGSTLPFGPYTSREFYSVVGWTKGRMPEYDYGAIILPPHDDEDELSVFAFSEFDERDHWDDSLFVTGYPADKPRGTMWEHARYLRELRERMLEYDMDTYGGNSGGPVYVYEEDSPTTRRCTALGIHSYGGAAGNSATRLTEEVCANIRRWSRQE